MIADEGATTASTVTFLIPVVSVVFGWLVLGEQLRVLTLIGMLLVPAGVALTRQNPAWERSRRLGFLDRAPAPRVEPTLDQQRK